MIELDEQPTGEQPEQQRDTSRDQDVTVGRVVYYQPGDHRDAQAADAGNADEKKAE